MTPTQTTTTTPTTAHAIYITASSANLSLHAVDHLSDSPRVRITITGGTPPEWIDQTKIDEVRELVRSNKPELIAWLVERGLVIDGDASDRESIAGRASAGGVGQGRGGRSTRQSTSDQTFHRLATLLTDRLRLALGISDGSQVIQVIALRGKPIKAVTLQDWIDRTNAHGHTAFSCTTAGREVAAYYPPTREDGLGGNPYAR